MNPIFAAIYALLLVGVLVANLVSFLSSRKRLAKMNFRFDDLGSGPLRRAALCVMEPRTCVWCVRLEQDTLRDEGLCAHARARGVRLLRCRPADFASLAAQRGWKPVRGLPTIVFVGSAGEEAGRRVGFCGAREMCGLIDKFIPDEESGPGAAGEAPAEAPGEAAAPEARSAAAEAAAEPPPSQ